MSTGLGQAKLLANMISQAHNMITYTIWFLRRSVCMYFPQDLLYNCNKYDELRKTLFTRLNHCSVQMCMIQDKTIQQTISHSFTHNS
jgi:hypothetical protein